MIQPGTDQQKLNFQLKNQEATLGLILSERLDLRAQQWTFSCLWVASAKWDSVLKLGGTFLVDSLPLADFSLPHV